MSINKIILFVFALVVLGHAREHGPNVIFYLVDDMGCGDIGAFGQTKFTTPNMDRMISEGIVFKNFYSGSTVCAPARTSLMTGLHTGHARIRNNSGDSLLDSDVTVGEIFKRAGYATAAIGKWGVGNRPSLDDPNKQGFDYFYGYINHGHAHNFFPEFLIRNGEKVALNNKCSKRCEATGKGVAMKVHNDYAPFFIRDEAIRFIAENAGGESPFFLYYAPNMPHTNNEGGYDGHGQEVPDYGEFASKGWPKVEKGFAQMQRYLDNDLGTILDTLNALGIEKQTLVIFSSDNGPHQEGGHNAAYFNSNGDFRGIKRDLWDGGIHVPFFAWWPGVIQPGSQTDFPAWFPDFIATAGELAGVSVPQPIDGISLLPVLIGETPHERNTKYFYWEFKEGKSTRTAILFQNWKLVVQEGKTMLYDLTSDIGENTNLASRYPDTLKKLKAMIADGHDELPTTVTWDSARTKPYNPHQSFVKKRHTVSGGMQNVRVIGRVIHVSGNSTCRLNLTSLNGRTVWRETASSGGRFVLNAENVRAGVYLLRVNSDGNSSARRILLN